jgi:hypothetical protein
MRCSDFSAIANSTLLRSRELCLYRPMQLFQQREVHLNGRPRQHSDVGNI